MIATLSMYDWPGQSAHWDALWSHIRDALRHRGLDAPDHLTRAGSLWNHWENPDLTLGQTCGMPYRQRLHGKVRLVGTLDHALPDAPPGYYYSVLVARRDEAGDVIDFSDKTLAYNGLDSESGWAAPQNFAARHGFRFTKKLHTGAHRDSARAVAEGRADIAAIDAETWRLVCSYLPDIAGQLRIVAHTSPTPGLPLITSFRYDPEAVLAAVESALVAADRATVDALHIRGVVRIPAEDYLAVPTPPIPSQDAPAA
ncbi:phosphate/phosphite/phosphonate ABC transporter substrate-binding protein [Silicimonas sp. MF1-12-2]|uniref:phosphate/phosphite/phosphonate ABC transporter substrate-binding protein n=1 Tax=Silicimonas sp. MF1-12-2 TaxID=3384793 RepID=UPI0039B5E872